MDFEEIRYHIKKWEELGDNNCNDTTYICDLDFIKYFSISDKDNYIETVFELLNGKYGFERNIYYDNICVNDDPLVINYNTLEMSVMNSDECLTTTALKKYKLTIFNTSHMITTSEYLKPICILLFSKYKNVEGISYVCNNLIHIISSILSQFVTIKEDIDCNTLSLPFSLTFLNNLNFENQDIKQIHSQIDNKLYKICPKES
ncbi:hypothetical protein QKT26_gp62 [Carcinus maenas nudivirus]|uniref:Uncharacterized protein n=1 Tax=Carcinus maenas nudivirus TaxID=2880837 RepID=A0AAE8Y2M0_9VIRU|nr:hypothetical protein QKT26_gp62 [Carcinus maenas nudivirus]UBZ25652.1 hypothetical protein CmNV_061 [Carcinus maenas nudivirus]